MIKRKKPKKQKLNDSPLSGNRIPTTEERKAFQDKYNLFSKLDKVQLLKKHDKLKVKDK